MCSKLIKEEKKTKNGARIKFQKILIIGGTYEHHQKVKKNFKKKYKKVEKSEKNIFWKKGKIFTSANEKNFRRRTKILQSTNKRKPNENVYANLNLRIKTKGYGITVYPQVFWNL